MTGQRIDPNSSHCVEPLSGIKPAIIRGIYVLTIVASVRLELTHLAVLDPKSSVSTNSTKKPCNLIIDKINPIFKLNSMIS